MRKYIVGTYVCVKKSKFLLNYALKIKQENYNKEYSKYR